MIVGARIKSKHQRLATTVNFVVLTFLIGPVPGAAAQCTLDDGCLTCGQDDECPEGLECIPIASAEPEPGQEEQSASEEGLCLPPGFGDSCDFDQNCAGELLCKQGRCLTRDTVVTVPASEAGDDGTAGSKDASASDDLEGADENDRGTDSDGGCSVYSSTARGASVWGWWIAALLLLRRRQVRSGRIIRSPRKCNLL